MVIIKTEKYKRDLKKLEKKYKKEFENNEKIENHIKVCRNLEELKLNVMSRVYNFEKLKGNNDKYWSFNLCKNRGTIRLICTVNEEENVVNLEHISFDHYKSLKKCK